MSRYNPSGHGPAAPRGALWSSPIGARSPSYQQQQQQQQQAAEEEHWRRQQQAVYEQDRQFYEQQQQQQEPDYDIYHKAVSASSPRFAGQSGNVDPNATITKTIVRRVEVPFQRSVQVPTQEVTLVPATEERRIPVRKMVQTPGYQTVNESYIEYEDREAIREKEVWVKKIVPEKYVERVPVQKVRQVQRPTNVIREVESWEVVSVPTTRRVVTPGYRVEEVPDSRVVEVEEEQTFALRPEPLGPSAIRSTRDLGRLPGAFSHLPDAPYGAAPSSGSPFSPSSSMQRPQSAQPRFGSSMGYNRTQPSPAPAAAAASPFGAPQNPLEMLRAQGLVVGETHTRHTAGTGVVVSRVERGSAAARAGLQTSDIITSVGGRPTEDVATFVALLSRAPASITITVNRDGRRNLPLMFNKQ